MVLPEEAGFGDDISPPHLPPGDIGEFQCGAMPGARLWVLPFETFAGRPDAQLAAVSATSAPGTHARDWLNATPRLPELRALTRPVGAGLPAGDGRWQPFAPAQAAALRETYADDLMWLAAGADGLAWLMDDPDKKWTGSNLSAKDMTRGRRYDDEERPMANSG